MAGWDDFVLVGRVARPQGHRGQVIVNPATEFLAERFAPGQGVWMLRNGEPAEVTIRDARVHKGRPVLTLEGVGTMNDAELLRDVELRVPSGGLKELPAGTFFHHELIGCTMTTLDGREIGVVRAVEGAKGSQRLVVGEGRGEVQVPLADEICVQIDLEARRIVVDPPEGLLDLNA